MAVKDLVGSRTIDYVLPSLYLTLVGIGWLMIYAVGHKDGYTQEFADFLVKTPVGKQSIIITVSLFVSFFIMSLDWKFWRTFAYGIYGVGLVGLVLVLFFGKVINGARAWFMFGGFGFQPVEVAKLGTCLALSSLMAATGTNIKDTRSQLHIGAILFVPLALIILQPDAGSCLVFASFSIMLFREGLSPVPYIVTFIFATVFIFSLLYPSNNVVFGLMTVTAMIFLANIASFRWIWAIGLSIILLICSLLLYREKMNTSLLIMLLTVLGFVVVHSRRGRFRMVILTTSLLVVCTAIVYVTSFVFNNVMKPHQRERINVWLQPEKCDPRGTAYNLLHSKMAIGSGGLQGKGFLEGTMTKLGHVPEQSTDFIFCTVGEEQGFIGTFALIMIFCLFLIRIIQIGERQRSNFSRHYAYGIAGIFFAHFLVNVGMTMGVMPVIGIPLPFISAGGSSMIGFTTMLAILLKLDSHRYSI
jgi:rod shape determining protein RodA